MKYSILTLFLLSLIANAKPSPDQETNHPTSAPSKKADKVIRGHVFAWPFIKASEMQPRGGTTRGSNVILSEKSSAQWTALQDDSISQLEKDRRAILAMAGSYRVSFDFMETMGFTKNYTPKKPYFSWGTEHVHVLKQDEKSISLQHTLVMYFKDKNGKELGPMIMKHWRQDWNYEDTDLHVYKGKSTWSQMTKPSSETKGKWTQAVFQVDDSPRYEVVGKWTHTGGMSVWNSAPCWRPLPRREFAVRSDYQVLQGNHEITITPSGWVHLQKNQKVSLTNEKQPTIIAQELGVNRYERIDSPSLDQAQVTWNKTGKYWAEVRKAWASVYAKNKTFSLKSKVDGKKLYQYHFAYAAKIEKEGKLDLEKATTHAQKTIHKFLITKGNQGDEGH